MITNTNNAHTTETERFQKESCGAEVRNAGGNVKAIIWSLYSLAAVFVGARLLGRMSSQYYWDDWTILACLVSLSSRGPAAQKTKRESTVSADCINEPSWLSRRLRSLRT